MPAAWAPVAWVTQAAIADGWASPLQTWRFRPTLASAVFIVAAVTTNPGICCTSGM
jgi:hypothetical protein